MKASREQFVIVVVMVVVWESVKLRFFDGFYGCNMEVNKRKEFAMLSYGNFLDVI